MVHDLNSTSAAQRLPVLALLSANAVSITGNAMASVAIPWFVLQTTGSAAKTGLTFAVIGLSNVLAAFFGGPVVDRLGYKRCSVITDIGSGVAVALVPLLDSTVGLEFWLLLVLVFLGGFIDMPGATARQSMLPSLAHRARMPGERANSAFVAVWRVSDFLGPPLGGVLVALIGATGVLWINASTFAVSAAAIVLGVPTLRLGSAPQSQVGLRAYIAQLREGLGFIRRERIVRTITAGAVAFNFLASPLLTVVVAVYAQRNFGNASSLGFMLGAFAGGVLLSSVLFGIFGHRLPRRTIFSLAVVAQWLPVWVLVFSPPLWASVAALGIAGLANGPVDPLIFTFIQERTPRRLLGRVNGATFALAIGAAPLGATLAGWALGAYGLKPVLIAIAAGLLIVSLTLVSIPALRDMNATKEP
jgi:MFS family permease